MPKPNTWAAKIAAEPDLEKKHELILCKHNNPVIGLAVELFVLRNYIMKSRTIGDVAKRASVAYVENRFRKFAKLALIKWKPESFEMLANAMRMVAHGKIRGFAGKPIQKLMWSELINRERSGTSIRALAKNLPQLCADLGFLDPKLVASADIQSIERMMRRIRKTMGLPPLTRNGA